MANTIDLDVNCGSATIGANTGRSITVNLSNVDVEEILSCLDDDLQTIIDHFGDRKILDLIGASVCKDHFDLTDKTE